MKKAWLSRRKCATILASVALASLGLFLTPLAVYAEEESMGCSDTVTVKLISPDSTNIPWVPIGIGIATGIIVLGLVLASRRNGRRVKHKHAS